MDLMTMLDEIPGVSPARDGEMFMWRLQDGAEMGSLEAREGDTPPPPDAPLPGSFATPEAARDDLTAYLHETQPDVLPASAQIVRFHPFGYGSEVTHVVWLG